MKLLLVVLTFGLSSGALAHDVQVSGYTKSDGTYVQSYHRSSPDSTTLNNYSTVGNTNPYTGSAGTKPAKTVESNPFQIK